MPITKRIAHYGSPKQLIEYLDTQKKFNMKGCRVAYHIIQSFSPKDNITPEQANEMGRKLCEELYPDFQCIITTHTDKGHIHNHISINAINLKGRKLEDRLSNEKEGLYGLSDTSDKIAAEYGCYIMPKKTYLKNNKKDFYYQYKEQSFKEKIKSDFESIIYNCNSIDEFLDEISIMGYKIKRGKHIAVKSIGMKKFARISTIDRKYSMQNLYKFFKAKNNIKLLGIKVTQNEFNSILWQKANESKIAIEKSQISTKGKIYNEYQKTKYQEIQRYYKLKKQLEYMDKYNIRSFDDIEKQIQLKRNQIKVINIELKNNKKKYDEIIEKTEKAQDYIQLYKVYEYAMSYKKIDDNYILPPEVQIFLKLQNELNIHSVEEAKNLIKSTRVKRIEINKKRKELLELQRELNHLDTIKEGKLSQSNLFIHNIKFGGNHIDYKLSDDDNFCINLPYTNEKIYIAKKFIAFNEKNQYYTLFLVDDKPYEIYNENNKKIGNITGIELEKYVLDRKKEIDKMYSQF